MLLDEPFSNLDVDLRERLAHEVRGSNVVAQTPLGDLTDLAECPLPSSYPGGECDVLLRADDIVHDDQAPVQAQNQRAADARPRVYAILTSVRRPSSCV